MNKKTLPDVPHFMSKLGGEPIHGLTHVPEFRDLNPATRVVVLECSDMTLDSLKTLLEELRTRCPAARVIGEFTPSKASKADDALLAGCDDVVVGKEHLRRTLAGLRWEVAMVDGFLEKQLSHQRLVSFIQRISASKELNEVLQTAVSAMEEILGIERVSVVLARPGNQNAKVVMEEQRKLVDIHISLQDYPEIVEVMRSGEPLFIADVKTHALLGGVSTKIEQAKAPPRSSILFPLILGEQTIGVLFFRSNEPLFSIDERRMDGGMVLAGMTSLALGRVLEREVVGRSYSEMIRGASAQDDLKLADDDFIELSRDGILILNEQGVILRANNPAVSILGPGQGTLIGNPLVNFVAVGSRDVINHALTGRLVGDRRGYLDFQMSMGGVGEATLSGSFRRIKSSGNWMLSFRDVSRIRRVESELSQTRDFLENVIQSSADAIVAADLSGSIIVFNRAAENLLGMEAQNVVGRRSVEGLYEGDGAREIMRRLRSGESGVKGQLRNIRASICGGDGAKIPVSLSAAIVYEGDTEVATVGVFSDLRERLRLEAELQRAQTQLKDDEKRRFVVELAGGAAHELNQPLTSILGYAELLALRSKDTDERGEKAISTIVHEAQRMATIVKRLGEITQVETQGYVGKERIADLRSKDDETS